MRLALVCDFLEEKWPSMDLIGDMLFQGLQANHSAEIEVEQLRPRLNPRFAKLPLYGQARILHNADRLLNRFADYPRWLRRRVSQFDLFHIVDHSYAQLAHDLPSGRTIVHCHDLDTFRCVLDPELERRPRWFRAMAQRILDGLLRSRHVICLSVSTKDQLLRHGLFPEDRITVIPPGADPAFFAPSDSVSEKLAAGLVGGSGQTYLLHVGSTIDRKRIDVLLRVFSRIADEFPQVQLVRVGGGFTRDQSRLAEALGLNSRIVVAPYLSKQTLAAVYRRAAIVLQTSEAEGFGLPVIEAMACGCPVLASGIGALREAGGVAAEYCPVGDIEAWSERLMDLLREREASPERWEVRRTDARRHASQFTWSENARRTIAIYGRVWSELKGAGGGRSSLAPTQ